MAIKMIERYGADEVIRAVEAACPARHAQLIITTAHRAKGLEWDRVRIGPDFREPLDRRTGEPLPVPVADAMLAYVAVTRAKTGLDTGGLAWIHQHLTALGHASLATLAPQSAPSGGQEASNALGTCSAPPQPEEYLRLDLETARAWQARYKNHPTDDPDDPLLRLLRERNDGTIRQIGADLSVPSPRPAAAQRPGGQARVVTDPERNVTSPPSIAAGDEVLVAGERGIFRVRSISKDGTYVAYAVDGTGGARSFRPEWCVPAWRQNPKRDRVPVRRVPASARQARDRWRAEHGLLFRPAENDMPTSNRTSGTPDL